MRTKNLGLVCIFGMIALLALGGCAGMQVRIGDGGKEILAEEAGFELGIYLGRKQPAAIPALQDFITAMEAATPGTAPDVMGLLKHYVTGRLIEDPIGQARLNRLLGLIKIDVGTPPDLINDENMAYLKAAARGLKQALEIVAP